MHITTLLQTLAFAVVAQSAAIPQDIPDGLYRRFINERGHEVNELLNSPRDAAPTTLNTPVNALQARDPNIHCGCGYGLDNGDCDAAVADLTNQLNGSGYVGANMAYYSIRGGVVAFACNGLSQAVEITGQLYGEELAYITSQCGLYTAGTFANQGFNTGYMQYYNGLDFCGAALGSNSQNC